MSGGNNDIKIAIVTDNNDKRSTYAQQKVRYKRAIKGGFYYEALLIDYALMEDRLKSFLYHAGVILDMDSKRIDCKKSIRPYIKDIYSAFSKEKDRMPSFNNISGKVDMIRALFAWSTTATEIPDDNPYLKMLKEQCESVDIGYMLEVFEKVDDWCKYRNEIIHSLMQKNMDSLNSEIKSRAEEGMDFANALDSFVKDMKKGNKVRKAAGLKTEK